MHKHCDTAVTKPTAKATPLALAMAAALGLSGLTLGSLASASNIIDTTWQGTFAFLDTTGGPFKNVDYENETNYYGWRTAVSGTLSLNLDTGVGTGTVDPFSFSSGGPLSVTNLSIRAIGDGMGNAGPLILGNMGISWNGVTDIPMSIVWDASGLFSCVNAGFDYSDTCAGVGALAATDNTKFGTGRVTYLMPIGPAPIATTTWNTTTIGGTTCGLGCNPSGTLPLIADTTVDAKSNPSGEVGIGGSPMVAGPFPGWNFNLDILSLHNSYSTCVPGCDNPVPIPAAAWLFGSGLLGLLGVARRQLQQRRR